MTERDLSCFLFPKSFETACELGPGSGAPGPEQPLITQGRIQASESPPPTPLAETEALESCVGRGARVCGAQSPSLVPHAPAPEELSPWVVSRVEG